MMIDVLHPGHLAKQYRADMMSAQYKGSVPVSINDLPNGEVMSIPDIDKETYIKIGILVKEEAK